MVAAVENPGSKIRRWMSRIFTRSAVARLLGVTEGTARYHRKRGAAGAVGGRGKQDLKAAAHAEAIKFWCDQQEDGRGNLAALHDWLRREHGYDDMTVA